MNAADLSSSALIVLELLSDGKPRLAKTMSERLEMKRTTLRNALQRMELFGLITMTELPNRKFDYQITPDGQTLIRRHRKAEQKVVTGMTTMPPTKPSTPPPAPSMKEQFKQQPKMVEWLRSMAASFNAMADSLS